MGHKLTTETRPLGSAAMLAATAALLLWPAQPAHADARETFIRSLDRPAATKVVKAKSDDDPTGDITCTYYADLMVRETGTNTPEPDAATLVPLAHAAPRPACNAAPSHGSIALKTQGYALDGRKGGFLIWDLSDPNGAEPFLVMSAQTGRVLFEDATSPALNASRTAVLDHGLLRLKYTRGYNADCSIVQHAQACWSKLAAGGNVPSALPPLTRAPKSCVAAYKGTGADDPSVITYTLDMTLDAAGKASVLSYGAPSCQPLP